MYWNRAQGHLTVSYLASGQPFTDQGDYFHSDEYRAPQGGVTVPTKLTRDVLESYLSCKLKAYLKLAGQKGAKCDYESLHLGVRGQVKSRVTSALCAGHLDSQIVSNV